MRHKTTMRYIMKNHKLDYYHKGLDLLVNAAAYIKEDLAEKNVKIDIYGPDLNGRYEHVRSLITNAEMTDIIRLHHEITGAEKERVLLDADIFIQTSRFEGMPLGVLEALAYGIPCIVSEGTNLGGEITKADAGWSAPNDAREIAKAIRQAIDSKSSYKNKGINGRRLVSCNYAWPVVSQQTISKYKALLQESEA